MADGAIHLSANCYLSWLKFYQKFYSDTKTTQTPVSERELAKKKIRKNLSKKKNEFKKKEKKLWKNRGVQCDWKTTYMKISKRN